MATMTSLSLTEDYTKVQGTPTLSSRGVVDRYRLIQPIGKGSGGSCQLAEDTELGQLVVVKQISLVTGSASTTSDSAAQLNGRNPHDLTSLALSGVITPKLKAALNEIEVLEAIAHPNIILYYDSFIETKKNTTKATTKPTVENPIPLGVSRSSVGSQRGGSNTRAVWIEHSISIVMEFAENGDLAQEIQRRTLKSENEEKNNKKNNSDEILLNSNLNLQKSKNAILKDKSDSTSDKYSFRYFSISDVWLILLQLLLALKYVHSRRILHRDIKTRNIFLASNGIIKLGDFGIAKQLADDMARTIVGSPFFMAPEIHKHLPYADKSDVWSLGCVLYEICTLRHAFQGDSLEAIFRDIQKYEKDLQNVQEEWKSNFRFGTNCDEQLSSLILKGDSPNSEYGFSAGMHQNAIQANNKIARLDLDQSDGVGLHTVCCRILTVDETQRPSIAQILLFPEVLIAYSRMIEMYPIETHPHFAHLHDNWQLKYKNKFLNLTSGSPMRLSSKPMTSIPQTGREKEKKIKQPELAFQESDLASKVTKKKTSVITTKHVRTTRRRSLQDSSDSNDPLKSRPDKMADNNNINKQTSSEMPTQSALPSRQDKVLRSGSGLMSVKVSSGTLDEGPAAAKIELIGQDKIEDKAEDKDKIEIIETFLSEQRFLERRLFQYLHLFVLHAISKHSGSNQDNDNDSPTVVDDKSMPARQSTSGSSITLLSSSPLYGNSPLTECNRSISMGSDLKHRALTDLHRSSSRDSSEKVAFRMPKTKTRSVGNAIDDLLDSNIEAMSNDDEQESIGKQKTEPLVSAVSASRKFMTEINPRGSISNNLSRNSFLSSGQSSRLSSGLQPNSEISFQTGQINSDLRISKNSLSATGEASAPLAASAFGKRSLFDTGVPADQSARDRLWLKDNALLGKIPGSPRLTGKRIQPLERWRTTTASLNSDVHKNENIDKKKSSEEVESTPTMPSLNVNDKNNQSKKGGRSRPETARIQGSPLLNGGGTSTGSSTRFSLKTSQHIVEDPSRPTSATKSVYSSNESMSDNDDDSMSPSSAVDENCPQTFSRQMSSEYVSRCDSMVSDSPPLPLQRKSSKSKNVKNESVKTRKDQFLQFSSSETLCHNNINNNKNDNLLFPTTSNPGHPDLHDEGSSSISDPHPKNVLMSPPNLSDYKNPVPLSTILQTPNPVRERRRSQQIERKPGSPRLGSSRSPPPSPLHAVPSAEKIANSNATEPSSRVNVTPRSPAGMRQPLTPLAVHPPTIKPTANNKSLMPSAAVPSASVNMVASPRDKFSPSTLSPTKIVKSEPIRRSMPTTRVEPSNVSNNTATTNNNRAPVTQLARSTRRSALSSPAPPSSSVEPKERYVSPRVYSQHVLASATNEVGEKGSNHSESMLGSSPAGINNRLESYSRSHFGSNNNNYNNNQFANQPSLSNEHKNLKDKISNDEDSDDSDDGENDELWKRHQAHQIQANKKKREMLKNEIVKSLTGGSKTLKSVIRVLSDVLRSEYPEGSRFPISSVDEVPVEKIPDWKFTLEFLQSDEVSITIPQVNSILQLIQLERNFPSDK